MKSIIAATLCAVAAATSSYKATKVGEWVPPNPPATETTHLKHLDLQVGDKLPAPDVSLDTDSTSFIEMAVSASEAAVEPQRVPHNWYVVFLLFGVVLFRRRRLFFSTARVF